MASAFAVSSSTGLGVGELKPQVCFSGCTQRLCSFKRTAGKEKPGHPKAVFWKLICNVDWVTPSRFVSSGVLCKLMKLEGVGEEWGGGGNRGIFIHLRQCDVLSMSHLNLGSGFIPVT